MKTTLSLMTARMAILSASLIAGGAALLLTLPSRARG